MKHPHQSFSLVQLGIHIWAMLAPLVTMGDVWPCLPDAEASLIPLLRYSSLCLWLAVSHVSSQLCSYTLPAVWSVSADWWCSV